MLFLDNNCAFIYKKNGFNNSEGCNVIELTCNHLFAPLMLNPKNNNYIKETIIIKLKR